MNSVALAVKRVAVVGNPNAGKTTLFNSLTGSNQKVGNYPGVTVERVVARKTLGNFAIDFVDVPGLYSLTPVSEDERVALQEIEGGVDGQKPDLLICVVDASNLERNLFLFTQIAELGIPTLLVLTMIDRLQEAGKSLDLGKLRDMVGCETVSVVAHRDLGLPDLQNAIVRNLESGRIPRIELGMSPFVEGHSLALRERLARLGFDYEASAIRDLVQNPTEEFRKITLDFPELASDYESAVQAAKDFGRTEVDIPTRYAWTSLVERTVITTNVDQPKKLSPADKIDRFLTHRFFGLIFFVGVMYLTFQSIYTFAGPLMDLIEGCFSTIQEWVGPKLEGNPILQSLIVDGVIAGIGGILVFLPQIVILFFFISVLEGTGYLARAAFLMDRLLGWCGLNGRAFIPLLSSFACAIPGIMAARVMPDPKSRLATILVAPLMSCSARLPVYLLLIGAFIQPTYGAFWSGFALFAMHLLGLVVAIPIVFILNRKMLKGSRLPFMLELPPYQWPKWKDVALAMYLRGKVFVTTAGTTILVMSVLIWAAGYFPQMSSSQKESAKAEIQRQQPGIDDQEIENRLTQKQLEQSVLGRFGKAVEPVFAPAGFDWRISTAILSAFPARETVVPSLGIIFSLGGDDEAKLADTLKQAKWPDGRPLFSLTTSISLMVFFALCAQCLSTLATVKRETNSTKWAVFMFVYMTALAYLCAVLVYQTGRLLGAA